MSKFELNLFANDEDLARSAAGEWIEEIPVRLSSAAPYCVALSGGRITRRFFSCLTDIARTRSTALNSVHFFWGDERCVPPSDGESNFAMAHELLFMPMGIGDAQIHRIHGEEVPEVAAAQAEAELRHIAWQDSNGQPVLDLIFLGMGEDGHVASLFPGESDETMASKAVYRAVTATKPPPRRITLGYAAIAAARQVWVLASGPGKEEALRESLAAAGQTPLGRVLKFRAHTRIFTDLQV